MKTLVLGSTSPFRKSILEKLQLPFLCATPNIDESNKLMNRLQVWYKGWLLKKQRPLRQSIKML
jgi:predicted house-cleaning NTP pyrophosphatase (Maf/HAM1 superfamily)